MESNLLEQLRNSYRIKKQVNDKKIEIEKELRELESISDVQRYIELRGIAKNMHIYSDDSLVRQVFINYKTKTKINSSIYVYMGSYIRDTAFASRGDFSCDDINSADYLLYLGIANDEMAYQIDTLESLDFEKKNIVIRFKDIYYASCYYYRLQTFYYKELLSGKSDCEILIEIMSREEEFSIEEVIIPTTLKYKLKELSKS